MSLLAKNSPKATREKQAEPINSWLRGEEVPVSKGDTRYPDTPVSETNQMISEYAYKPDELLESSELLKSSATKKLIPEQLANPLLNGGELLESSELLKSSATKKLTLSFFDLSFFCEERMHIVLHEPMNIKAIRIINTTKEFIQNKLEIYSEWNEEVKIGKLKDRLYYKEGLVLLPEEYYIVSGFLREYLKIEEVLVLYKTGEVLKRPTKYCNFWIPDRLNKLSEFNPGAVSQPVILSEKSCLRCNLTCNFRHKQQMVTK